MFRVRGPAKHSPRGGGPVLRADVRRWVPLITVLSPGIQMRTPRPKLSSGYPPWDQEGQREGPRPTQEPPPSSGPAGVGGRGQPKRRPCTCLRANRCCSCCCRFHWLCWISSSMEGAPCAGAMGAAGASGGCGRGGRGVAGSSSGACCLQMTGGRGGEVAPVRRRPGPKCPLGCLLGSSKPQRLPLPIGAIQKRTPPPPPQPLTQGQPGPSLPPCPQLPQPSPGLFCATSPCPPPACHLASPTGLPAEMEPIPLHPSPRSEPVLNPDHKQPQPKAVSPSPASSAVSTSKNSLCLSPLSTTL